MSGLAAAVFSDAYVLGAGDEAQGALLQARTPNKRKGWTRCCKIEQLQ